MRGFGGAAQRVYSKGVSRKRPQERSRCFLMLLAPCLTMNALVSTQPVQAMQWPDAAQICLAYSPVPCLLRASQGPGSGHEARGSVHCALRECGCTRAARQGSFGIAFSIYCTLLLPSTSGDNNAHKRKQKRFMTTLLETKFIRSHVHKAENEYDHVNASLPHEIMLPKYCHRNGQRAVI